MTVDDDTPVHPGVARSAERPTATATLARALGEMPARMRLLAEAVLDDPERAAHESGAELAARAEVSAATVSRLSRHVGYGSFAELQKALSHDLGRTAVEPSAVISAGIRVDDDVRTVIEKVVHDVRTVSADTRASLDPESLSRAADLAVGARRIVLFGIGASGLVARDLQLKFERIGLASTDVGDLHRGLTVVSAVEPGDLVVCFSHSGTTRETLAVARLAHDQGAAVVAVTGRARSPLAQRAHLVLLGVAGAESELRPGALGSRMSQLVIVDSLFVIVAQRTYDRTEALLASSWRAVRPLHEE